MNAAEVIKSGAAFGFLKRDAENNALAHAYLIESSDRRTLELITNAFLAQCLYSRSDDEAIERAATAAADVVRLPHTDKVLVGDVDEIRSTVYVRPQEYDKKFYIIDYGETMNDASQNKLLKILEEPPESVVIIIKCTQAKNLLPTVLSRVRRVPVETLSLERMLDYLTEKNGEDSHVRVAAALSGGYLGRAEQILADDGWNKIFGLALDTLENMKNSRYVLGFSARLIVFKDRLHDYIDALELLLHQSMLYSEGYRSPTAAVPNEDLARIAAEYNSDVVLRLRPALTRARERLKYNGNPQSVADELLFTLLEVKAKCKKS